ncbi:MAG: right-handed parallel beta-helix repeat-containing protein, partial [Deltaproteobacteria bacterium]|nr:right-handed parallel beta-helix repeat-containing protein [Deltaproteobacteria bacterium]
FNGLLNVKWGTGPGEVEPDEIGPGDTLWVCGLHVHDFTGGSFETAADIVPMSGIPDARIVIRGDYPNDPGIIWGCHILNDNTWLYEGSDVWSQELTAGLYPDWFFQDIGVPDNDDYIVLDKFNTLQELKDYNGNNGGHYSDTYARGTKLYIKCTDKGNPINRLYGNRYGYDFILANREYITFLNLTFHNFNRVAYKIGGLSHIRWEGCKIDYGEHSLLGFWYANDHIEVINCELAWAANGIYCINQDESSIYRINQTIRNSRFSGNYIHDIGVREINANSDAHGISPQGGRDNIIEDNYFERCHRAILLYAFTHQEIKNTIVRRNVVINPHKYLDRDTYGISTQCDNDSLSDKSGNEFYLNIVVGHDYGYRFQFEDEQKFNYNIAYNCGIGLGSARTADDGGTSVGAKITGKNNIIIDSTNYHVHFGTGASFPNAFLDMNYNLYYPDGESIFFHMARYYDFAGWQITDNRHIGEPNSILGDPLFTTTTFILGDPLFTTTTFDVSGLEPKEMALAYAKAFFTPSEDSPFIDKGEYVEGIDTDFEGNPIISPDMGIFEYLVYIAPPVEIPADDGGTITIDEGDYAGTEVEIPEGALPEDTTVSIVVVPNPPDMPATM